MKKVFTIIALELVVSFACQSVFAQKDSKTFAPIKVETPSRPAGQKDVIQLVAPKIDTVRVGFIGLGMRGVGAVERWIHIPGTRIVALCDIRTERVEKSQKILKKQVCPKLLLIVERKMHGKNFVKGMISTLCILSRIGNIMLKWECMRWNMANM